jgi:uncharacterized protein (DUF433 family)
MFDEDRDGNEDILIISDEQFMDGNPIVKGTHITVEQILLELARGMSIEKILDEHPQLTMLGIKAALKFAAESVHFDHVTPQIASLPEEEQNEASHEA